MTALDSALDLNLLRPLMALLHERHVSRAASAVNLTQPAMSRSLARLRTSLGDELLVRSGQGYELTPRAQLLLVRLGELMPELQRTLDGDRFDPQARGREYRVAGADPIATVLAPALSRLVSAGAGRSSLRFGSEPARVDDELARGLCDLVISPEPTPAGMCREAILSAGWVCALDATHPLARRERLDLETWIAATHITVASTPEPFGAGGRPGAWPPEREIRLTVPDHAAALSSVRGSPLIATLAEPFVRAVGAPAGVRVLDAPAELEAVRWFALWHPREDRNPALEWLRSQVRAAARR